MSDKDRDNKDTGHPFRNTNSPNNPYNIDDRKPQDGVDRRADGEKVVLGDEVYEAPEPGKVRQNPVVPEREARRNQVGVDKSDDRVVRDKKGRGVFDNIRLYIIGLAVVAVLALFANTIQNLLFRSPDSLIFLGNPGLLKPPVGVILMGIGLLMAIFAAVSFVHKNSRHSGKQKGTLLLLGLLVAAVGLTSFFRYVDFRENTILDRSLLSSRAHTYFDVTEVRADFDGARPEGQRLIYSFVLPGNDVYDIIVSSRNMEALKTIDTKVLGTAKRSMDNFALQEIVRIGMYTEEEALRLFFPR